MSLEAFNVCLADTLESTLMRILLYMGIFNGIIIFAVFIIRGEVSKDIVKKMRKLIFYAFACIAIPFLAAFIRFLKM